MDINPRVNRAYVEAVLVGVPLPATKRQLVAYARAQPNGEAVAERLASIPDREYVALQDVGEELEPRQPERREARAVPKVESGAPPGGPAYVGGEATPPNLEAERLV
jgi:hypothetical protein